MRSALAKLFLIGLGISVGTALVEIALRIVPGLDLRVVTSFQSPPWKAWADPAWGNPGGPAYRTEPTLVYDHGLAVDMAVPAAGHPRGTFRFRTNNLGLRRDRDTMATKSPDILRILVLGDSHTDGYVNNDESFCALLESSLTRRLPPGRRVEVLNAGIAGYSPAQEFLWYKMRGALLEPDLVVVVFYVGNDVVELEDPSKPNVDPATGRPIPSREGDPSRIAPGPGRFASASTLDAIRVFALLRYAVQLGPLAPMWQQLSLPGRVTDLGGFRMDTLIQVLRACHGCFLQSLQQIAHARRYPEKMRGDIRRAAEILIRLDGEVRSDGHRLVVAVLPTFAQADLSRASQERSYVANLLQLDPTDLAFEDEVESAVLGRLLAAGVPVFSLREPLRQAALNMPQYYSRDWHLGHLGHRTVAAALEMEMLDRGLLPVRSAR